MYFSQIRESENDLERYLYDSSIYDEGEGPRMISVSPKTAMQLRKEKRRMDQEDQNKSYLLRGREAYFNTRGYNNEEKSLLKVSVNLPEDFHHDFHKRRHRPGHVFRNRKTVFASHASVFEDTLAERILEDEMRDMKTYFAKSYEDKGLEFSTISNGNGSPKKFIFSDYQVEHLHNLIPDYSIFANKHNIPSKVKLGYVKSHKFQSALAAVSENSQRLQRLLHYNKRGPKVLCGLEYFGIFLNCHGVFNFYIVDDRVAYSNEEGHQNFLGSMPYKSQTSNTIDLNYYIYIFEKAYAERVKGFLNIEKMGIDHCLFDLTGAPTQIVRHHEIELIASMHKIDIPMIDMEEIKKEWMQSKPDDVIEIIGNFLKHCLKKGWIVMAKAHKDSEDFIPGCWYPIIDFVRFSFDEDELLKIRNPYPDEKLEMQDLYHVKHSRYMTKDVLQDMQKDIHGSIGLEKEKAGLVYLNSEEYYENFSDEIAVCFYHEKFWLSSRFDYILDDGKNLHDLAFFEIKVTREGTYYFGISQPEIEDYRFLKISIFEVRYRFDKISGLIYMCGNSRSDRDVWCRKTLTRGHYLIAISFTNLKHTGMQNYEEYSSDSDSYSSSDYQSSEDLGLEEKDNYGIWIYGVGGVKIDKIKEGYTKKKLMNFFIKGLISYALKRKELWESRDKAYIFKAATPCGYYILAAKCKEGKKKKKGDKEEEKETLNVEMSFMSEKHRMVYPNEQAYFGQKNIMLQMKAPEIVAAIYSRLKDKDKDEIVSTEIQVS